MKKQNWEKPRCYRKKNINRCNKDSENCSKLILFCNGKTVVVVLTLNVAVVNFLRHDKKLLQIVPLPPEPQLSTGRPPAHLFSATC